MPDLEVRSQCHKNKGTESISNDSSGVGWVEFQGQSGIRVVVEVVAVVISALPLGHNRITFTGFLGIRWRQVTSPN